MLAAGCELRTDFYATDTEGWGFRVSCRERACRVRLSSPYPAPGVARCEAGSAPGYALVGRQVAVVCPGCVREDGTLLGGELARCRALRCANDRECPPFRGEAPLRCVNGLCQSASTPGFDPHTNAGLCMAGAGPMGNVSRETEQRMALASAACVPVDPAASTAPSCRAPAGCRPP